MPAAVFGELLPVPLPAWGKSGSWRAQGDAVSVLRLWDKPKPGVDRAQLDCLSCWVRAQVRKTSGSPQLGTQGLLCPTPLLLDWGPGCFPPFSNLALTLAALHHQELPHG